VGAHDHLAIFLGGQALTRSLSGTLIHRQLQLNTFNSTNLRKARIADDETGFAAFSCRALFALACSKSSTFFAVCPATPFALTRKQLC
jgi:hypothetical protein